MNRHRVTSSAVLVWLGLSGCSAVADESEAVGPDKVRLPILAQVSVHDVGRYLVVFAVERVPADFGERVASLSGAVEASLDSIGVASVTGLTESGAAELAAASGVMHVEPDIVIAAATDEGIDTDLSVTETLATADATASPTSAQFYARQWNMRAVFAPEAWAAGQLGSREVVVAILDTGIDYLHPDLVGLVDLARSTSFVPEDVIPARYPGRLPISDLHWHGTAVASVVASNATLLAGVNRYVTLLAVKTTDSTFSSSLGRLISGIVYAADQGADVINLSRGGTFDKNENPGILAAFERAVNYAFRKGALLVTIADNDGADLDHNGDAVKLPCEVANALCVSGSGPTAADGINGPWTDVDARAPYSSFGRSAIHAAAPSGTGNPGQFRRVWLPCTTTPTATTGAPACRSGPAPRLAQGSGTSFAAPHVAGLAALLVAQLGHGNPALIRARILQSADDLGEPGVDPYYGHGRINIARVLGVVP
jgi:subtilisin family serine protease